MTSSLQEQLLKAGLITEQQVRDSRKGKRRERSSGRGSAAAADVARREAEASRREKQRRDRELNDKREAERREKELRQRIRDLVLAESLNDDAADVAYNVLHGPKVRRIYVTAAQRDGLVAGALAVATARGRHHVIPGDVADRIASMMPDYFVYRPAPDAAADAAADDPYAAYKIPDDLTW